MLQSFDPRNRDLLININGQLIHRDQAGVSPFDSAVQGGDAVWEGLRLYNGRIFKLREHLRRLRDSAVALAFERIPGDDEIIEQIRRTLAANQMTDGVHIRLTLTRGVKYTSGMDPRLNAVVEPGPAGQPRDPAGRPPPMTPTPPTLIILAEHKPPVYDKGGITLITSSVRRFPPDCLDPKIHHCNLIQSILAKIQANQSGADDALMLDVRGFVAETNATNVFIVRNDEAGRAIVLTPRPVACPEGITRATVIELCHADGIPCAEADISLTEVYRADEVFCTGTMGEIAPVITVDGRRIGDGTAGATTQRIATRFRELTERSGERIL